MLALKGPQKGVVMVFVDLKLEETVGGRKLASRLWSSRRPALQESGLSSDCTSVLLPEVCLGGSKLAEADVAFGLKFRKSSYSNYLPAQSKASGLRTDAQFIFYLIQA